MGISGIFAPASAQLVRAGALAPAELSPAVENALPATAAHAAAPVHPDLTPTVAVTINFTCAVSGAGYCSPQYWTNGTTIPIWVTTSNFALGATSTANITLLATLKNSTSHATLATVNVTQGWAPFTSGAENNISEFSLLISNGTLGLTWAQFIGANFGNFTLTAAANVNVTTGATNVFTAGTGTSHKFVLLTTTAMTIANDVQYFTPGTDPLTGAPYAVAPFNASFNLTLANLPFTGMPVTQTIDLTVVVSHFEGATYASWSLGPITAPADGTTTWNATVSEANLGCGTPVECYQTINELPFVISLEATWTIQYGTDANNASTIAAENDTGQLLGGGLEIMTGPGFGVSYSGLTPITGYSTITASTPLNVTVNVTSFNAPTATPLGGWVTVRNVLSGDIQGTWSLNGSFSAADLLNTAGSVPVSVNFTGLGCAATGCANIATSPFNISATFVLGWSVVSVTKAAYHATSFITVPLASKLGISASNTINGPTTTGVVGTGNVVFNATVTGQYILSVIVTVFSLTGATVFTGSLLNSTTGAPKTATWYAGSTGAYSVDLNVTTDYAYVFSISQPLAVVLAGSPVYFNQTTYHNNSIIPGLSGAAAGTLLLLIGLIVGIIVALLVGRMMWGGRQSAAPAQPWESKSGTPMGANVCSVCGKSFDTPEALAAHAKAEHGAE